MERGNKEQLFSGQTQTQPSAQFSCSVISNSFQPHGLQYTMFPCPSPAPKACSNSCPSSWWWTPTTSAAVTPFCSCLQSFPASRTFPTRQLLASGGQSIGISASASILPINIQDWFPLGLIGCISLLFTWLSRVFSNVTVQNLQFFSAKLSL